ncbi:hypothetical protein [Vibrio sp. 99-70-13A1]|uniref:hypothetical protein n=1 Tax=Vibrio sp. 99-70-13A1 TaxID=2607601 RepID=UPI0014934C8B|nr:hypothetical protein [Vibrio sp. 99-70-13A1]NOH95716.1 hypothetical protein [Vibrio sp. 99-70-13A1]
MERSQLKGRVLLVSLILIFALPAIIAKLVLSQQWYTAGVTNFGELIEPKTTLTNVGVDILPLQEGWLLAYVVPQNCNRVCEQQVHLLGQSYLALGKYKERVKLILLIDKGNNDTLKDMDLFREVRTDLTNNDPLLASSVVIVDPLGQLVMRYQGVSNQALLVKQSKGILHDLRKLLKLSRVG